MDSELIEKAAKAIGDASEDGNWLQMDEVLREWCRRDARAALAVFEAAQKPTDDERVYAYREGYDSGFRDGERGEWRGDNRLPVSPSDDEREALAKALNRDARRIRESRDRAGIEFGSMTVPIDVMLKLTESAPSLEPQTEPTDAQVRAAWDSLGPSVTIHLEYEQLIAALRAAAETTNRENRSER